MRYSKTRIITTTIISISCFLLVIFAIYKGVEFAKQANEAEDPSLKASVTEKKDSKKEAKKIVKEIKKKVKKTTKKKTETKKKTTTKKVVKKDTATKETKNEKTTDKTIKEEKIEKKETSKTSEVKKTETPKKEEVKEQETKKEEKKEEEGPTFDNSIVGKYVIKELTYQGKTYTKKEIEKLIKEGYSMKLEIKESGLATLSVLSINKMYEVNDTYFDDGQEQVEYSHSNTRIRVTVDDAKMLFIKK